MLFALLRPGELSWHIYRDVLAGDGRQAWSCMWLKQVWSFRKLVFLQIYLQFQSNDQ